MDRQLLEWLGSGSDDSQQLAGDQRCPTTEPVTFVQLSESGGRFLALALLWFGVGAIVGRFTFFSRPHFELLDLAVCFTVLFLITLSLFPGTAVEDLPCHFLLAVSRLDALVLLVVFCSHAFDLGVWVGCGLTLLDKATLLVHHPLTLVGIAFMLTYRIGGGAIVRLLLDSTTYFLYLAESLLVSSLGPITYSNWKIGGVRLSRVFNIAYWLCWTVFRMIYYSYICMLTCYHLVAPYFDTSGTAPRHATFAFMFVIWSGYAMIDHFVAYADMLSAASTQAPELQRIWLRIFPRVKSN